MVIIHFITSISKYLDFILLSFNIYNIGSDSTYMRHPTAIWHWILFISSWRLFQIDNLKKNLTFCMSIKYIFLNVDCVSHDLLWSKRFEEVRVFILKKFRLFKNLKSKIRVLLPFIFHENNNYFVELQKLFFVAWLKQLSTESTNFSHNII